MGLPPLELTLRRSRRERGGRAEPGRVMEWVELLDIKRWRIDDDL